MIGHLFRFGTGSTITTFPGESSCTINIVSNMLRKASNTQSRTGEPIDTSVIRGWSAECTLHLTSDGTIAVENIVGSMRDGTAMTYHFRCPYTTGKRLDIAGSMRCSSLRLNASGGIADVSFTLIGDGAPSITTHNV